MVYCIDDQHVHFFYVGQISRFWEHAKNDFPGTTEANIVIGKGNMVHLPPHKLFCYK